MKTILLSCSLALIIAVTLVFGGIEPPAQQAHAETTVSKALQEPEKTKTVNEPSPTPTAPVTINTPVPEPIQLTDRQQVMKDAGIAEDQWASAENIINLESGWCPTKWEGEYGACPTYHGIPGSGGYGLCQSTPAGKMAVEGEGWETDTVKQLQWCNSYAQGYGGWNQAKAFRDCTGYCFSPRTNSTVFKRTTWF